MLGQDTLNGHETTIFEVFYPAEQIVQKVWLWNETGLELKLEMEKSPPAPEPSVRTTIEWTDFGFEAIPDSVFAVPEEKIAEDVSTKKR